MASAALNGSDVTVDLVQSQSYCKLDPSQDLDTKYCGLFGELRLPEYPNNIDQLTLKTGLIYTSIVEIAYHGDGDPIEAEMLLSFDHEDPGAQFLHQVTNITAGDNLASRYYYEAKCTSAASPSNSWLWREDFTLAKTPEGCASASVSNLKLQRRFPAKMLVVIADHRLATIVPGFIDNPSIDYFRQKPIGIKLQVVKQQKSLFGGVSNKPTVLREISWSLQPEELMNELDKGFDRLAQYVYYGNLGCASISVVFFFLVLLRRGCCCCSMRTRMMHVEVKDKLRVQEMYESLDFIDMFMYFHKTQDDYHLRKEAHKLKKKLQKLQIKNPEEEVDEPDMLSDDIENQPLFSANERQRLTQVRNTLVQELMIVEYKVNICIRPPLKLEAVIEDISDVSMFERSGELGKMDLMEKNGKKVRASGVGMVDPTLTERTQDQNLYDCSLSDSHEQQWPAPYSKRLLNGGLVEGTGSAFLSELMAVPNEMDGVLRGGDGSARMESLGGGQKGKNCLALEPSDSHDDEGQRRQKAARLRYFGRMGGHALHELNQSVLLKGENYKSKFTVPPIIRDELGGLGKRYNSLEDDERVSEGSLTQRYERVDIFSDRDYNHKIDLLDRTQQHIYPRLGQGELSYARAKEELSGWHARHRSLKGLLSDEGQHRPADLSLDLSYLNEQLAMKVENLGGQPKRTRAKLPPSIPITRDQRADLTDLIYEEACLSQHNIQPQYMIDLMDGPTLHQWIMNKRRKERHDLYSRYLTADRTGDAKEAQAAAAGFQSLFESHDTRNAAEAAFTTTNSRKKKDFALERIQQILRQTENRQATNHQEGKPTRNLATIGSPTAWKGRTLDQRRTSRFSPRNTITPMSPTRNTEFRIQSRKPIDMSHDVSAKVDNLFQFIGIGIGQGHQSQGRSRSLITPQKSIVTPELESETPSIRKLSLKRLKIKDISNFNDRTSGMLSESCGDKQHSISKILKSRVKKGRARNCVSASQITKSMIDEKAVSILGYGASEHDDKQSVVFGQSQERGRATSPAGFAEFRSPRRRRRSSLAGRRSTQSRCGRSAESRALSASSVQTSNFKGTATFHGARSGMTSAVTAKGYDIQSPLPIAVFHNNKKSQLKSFMSPRDTINIKSSSTKDQMLSGSYHTPIERFSPVRNDQTPSEFLRKPIHQIPELLEEMFSGNSQSEDYQSARKTQEEALIQNIERRILNPTQNISHVSIRELIKPQKVEAQLSNNHVDPTQKPDPNPNAIEDEPVAEILMSESDVSRIIN